MQKLIGRQKEIQKLRKHLQSHKSEFVAIYGRRRVGKTFLVRQVFDNQFAFQLTGMANVNTRGQLTKFHAALQRYFPQSNDLEPAKNWFTAFEQLITLLEADETTDKKVIFLDELPWLDTRGANFLSGLEHFWNSWASARDDILLIVCGSAASWMVKNLLKNRGGLHNRVTDRMKLSPFNLAETEELLKYKGIVYDRYQIILLYMVFGGIPFYLEKIDSRFSATQNVNELCFEYNAPFRDEYEELYASLFKKSEKHLAIIEALAQKKKGLSRAEIIRLTKLSNGGGLTRVLKELEESSFIRRYQGFGKKKRESLYQLVDFYSLFYLNFIQKSSPDDENFWINALQSPTFRAWSGYAFEMVCLHHVSQIKQALGIAGVQTSVATWTSPEAQIDLLIDRKDRVINLCEMKFSISPFTINKQYAANLRNKMGSFREATQTKKAIFLTIISTYGLAQSPYKGMIQNDLTMVVLFE
ncbi:MAG: ATP-binding protein [Chitinophagales bacterium]